MHFDGIHRSRIDGECRICEDGKSRLNRNKAERQTKNSRSERGGFFAWGELRCGGQKNDEINAKSFENRLTYRKQYDIIKPSRGKEERRWET